MRYSELDIVTTDNELLDLAPQLRSRCLDEDFSIHDRMVAGIRGAADEDFRLAVMPMDLYDSLVRLVLVNLDALKSILENECISAKRRRLLAGFMELELGIEIDPGVKGMILRKLEWDLETGIRAETGCRWPCPKPILRLVANLPR
jgi:hypothetical protein